MNRRKFMTTGTAAAVGLGTVQILSSRGQEKEPRPTPAETTNEYVAPPDAGPKGKAPRMRVQLLNDKEATKQYAVIFYQGDEAFSGLLEFAQKYHLTSAHFTAIGAVSGATLGWFDPQRKMYKKIPINGQHEGIGMSGDVALYQGKPVGRTHMVVGASDGTTRAGHVLAAYVSPTLEVMVTVDPVTMQKRFDPDTDLTLINPASQEQFRSSTSKEGALITSLVVRQNPADAQSPTFHDRRYRGATKINQRRYF